MTTPYPSKPTCPFPVYHNPHEEEVAGKLREWIREYSDLTAEQHIKLKRISIESMVAYWYPTADLSTALAMARFFLWGFAYDDAYPYRNKNELEMAKERSLEVLNGSSLKESDNVFHGHLASVRNEILLEMPQHWQQRFIGHVLNFLEGVALEMPFNEEGVVPTIEEYMAIRTRSIGVEQMMDLSEFSSRKAVPEHILQHPVMSGMRSLVIQILIWSNDYYSVGKERGKEVMNAVLIIEKDQQCSQEEAQELLIHWHRKAIGDFVNLEKELPDLGAFTPVAEDHVAGLKYIIAGDLAWYERTRRYTMMQENGK